MIRAFDVVVSTTLLTVLAPLMALIALAIRVESVGNPIFRQPRTGRAGRVFVMWKFRSMRAGAPVIEATHRIEDFASFVYAPAGRRDTRVTRLGSILRATSLDELPQILNILRGEMSLVGPRPELPELAEQYPPEARRRLEVPPGITGLAQVSGRADLSYGEVVAYDLAYVDTRSLTRNVEILGMTLAAVLTRRGAR